MALAAAQVADWASWRRTADAAYSAVFNLRYWDVISERLGGRSAFWKLVDSRGPSVYNGNSPK